MTIEATTWYRAVCDACKEPLDLDGGEYRRSEEAAQLIALEEGWSGASLDRLICEDCAYPKAVKP